MITNNLPTPAGLNQESPFESKEMGTKRSQIKTTEVVHAPFQERRSSPGKQQHWLFVEKLKIGCVSAQVTLSSSANNVCLLSGAKALLYHQKKVKKVEGESDKRLALLFCGHQHVTTISKCSHSKLKGHFLCSYWRLSRTFFAVRQIKTYFCQQCF